MPQDSRSDNSKASYKWTTELKASIEDETALKFSEVWEANDERLPIRARVVDTTINKNKWRIPDNEIDNIVEQIRAGIPIKLDHSKDKVRDIVGRFEGAEKIIEDGITRVFGTGFLNDRQTAKSVWDKTTGKVSIDGIALKHSCMECGASMLGRKKCRECGNDTKEVTDWTVKETSIVDDPAYDNMEILPFQFSAALDKQYNEQIVSVNKEELEASRMGDEDKKKIEAMEKELNEYKAKCKAMEEDKKKEEEEEAKAAEEEDKKKEEEEAKASLQKELDEQKAKNEYLEANLRKNAGVSGGVPDDKPVGTTDDVLSELRAHFDKDGGNNPFSLQG